MPASTAPPLAARTVRRQKGSDMSTQHSTTSSAPAGRCLTCGEHVSRGQGTVTGAGIVHSTSAGCSAAIRYVGEVFVVAWRTPAWASAQLEPDGTPVGAPADQIV